MTSLKKLAALSVSTLLLAGSALAGQFTVESGKTKQLRLKTDASSVVIGNPNIADVAVANGKLLFVSGKAFGTTNLLIFDSAGNTIYAADVVVTTNSANLVTVNRAGANYSYDCAPECRAGLAIGDSDEHFESIFNQMDRQKELSE